MRMSDVWNNESLERQAVIFPEQLWPTKNQGQVQAAAGKMNQSG